MKFFSQLFRSDRMLFPLACLVVAAIMLISETAYWQSVGRLVRVAELTRSQDSLQRLMQGIVDAETGTRGFLLTGGPEYLEPYRIALGNIEQAMQQIDERFGNDPESAARLAKLHDLTGSKVSELDLTIRLVREGNADATLEILKSGIGREKMDGIRAISHELLAGEERSIAQGRAGIHRTLALSRIGIIVLALSGLLALFMYQRQTTRLKLQQLEQKRMVQAERDRLEVEVIERTAQLTKLTQHIQTAREDERHRLARNLHDDLGALLTSAKLDAARIKSRIARSAPEAMGLLAHLVETLNSGIAMGRRIIEDLRPSALGNLGLAATLDILAREFADATGVEVECVHEPVELDPAAQLVAYRLVQEAITNVTKYAGASRVWITLARRGEMVAVSVRDNGAGFDPQVKRASAYGLVGMQFRVEACGGKLTIESAPGRGTVVSALLPPRVAPADAGAAGN